MTYTDLPHLNALLNMTSALLVLTGYYSITRKRVSSHRKFMLGGLFVSAAFFVSYLTYHAHAGSVRFQGEGWLRTLYFAILLSHTVLATVIVPMVLVTVRFALKRQFDRHVRIARWTFPIWVYVSVTGVIVYWMLYH